ncbi:TetR/AcrR family transcriptional regulator [Euzebya sp.]|uniref:TetR/AcrR family transcriptional regulator n=1 Tax=Euzebya sp. TaxID=1971409 RepID=UPI0035171892
MPRRGVTRDRVVDAAAALVDAGGPEAVTLAAVADAVGIRTPSLYNHVEGLAGLRRDLAVHAVRQLGGALSAAADGAGEGERVVALGRAYRGFALAHPGLHAMAVRAPEPDDAEHAAAAAEVVDVVIGALGDHGVGGTEAIHATRGLRSVLHGFAAIELGGGFGLDVDVDASFEWVLGVFVAGLSARARG